MLLLRTADAIMGLPFFVYPVCAIAISRHVPDVILLSRVQVSGPAGSTFLCPFLASVLAGESQRKPLLGGEGENPKQGFYQY